MTFCEGAGLPFSLNAPEVMTGIKHLQFARFNHNQTDEDEPDLGEHEETKGTDKEETENEDANGTDKSEHDLGETEEDTNGRDASYVCCVRHIYNGWSIWTVWWTQLQKIRVLEVSKVLDGDNGWCLITCKWLHGRVFHLLANVLFLCCLMGLTEDFSTFYQPIQTKIYIHHWDHFSDPCYISTVLCGQNNGCSRMELSCRRQRMLGALAVEESSTRIWYLTASFGSCDMIRPSIRMRLQSKSASHLSSFQISNSFAASFLSKVLEQKLAAKEFEIWKEDKWEADLDCFLILIDGLIISQEPKLAVKYIEKFREKLTTKYIKETITTLAELSNATRRYNQLNKLQKLANKAGLPMDLKETNKPKGESKIGEAKEEELNKKKIRLKLN
ncbi:hypothetical protein POM88_047977 [Heracleum sosnowskyi]|uniref:Uncharacterized protein n=1 Tax=Heracleum sosnowskyi TaxID=360622 RepID=A0AAD8LZ82_9APIA|nr:hypothetical protein POM88_047977 [Heracleum sosnowskyi]